MAGVNRNLLKLLGTNQNLLKLQRDKLKFFQIIESEICHKGPKQNKKELQGRKLEKNLYDGKPKRVDIISSGVARNFE